MPNQPIEISEILQAGFVVEDQSVALICVAAGQPLELRLPATLLTRLVALTLHLAGKLEDGGFAEMTALAPEGMELCSLPDDSVGLRLLLPGGAPLTFSFDHDDAHKLAEGLAAHLRTTTPIITTRQ